MNPFADRFSSIVALLCAALGAFGRRIANPPQPVWLGTRCYLPATEPDRLPPLPIPAWNLFIARIQRTARRIEALFAQWQQGTLKPTRPARPAARSTAQTLRLPRTFGWANLRAREVHPIAGLLDTLVREPHARGFLTEVPRAARLVRPLCQALGVAHPAWLTRAPHPRKPRPSKSIPGKPRQPGPRPQCLPLTHPSLGLQPYVIAAARHAKKSDNPG